jgi:hypothetical protein
MQTGEWPDANRGCEGRHKTRADSERNERSGATACWHLYHARLDGPIGDTLANAHVNLPLRPPVNRQSARW